MQRNVQFPVILFLDGHRSHISMDVSNLARKLNIILIGLYPNSTHIMQPLDTCVFGPIKKAWSNLLSEKRKTKLDYGVEKKKIPSLVSEFTEKHLSKENAESGFKSCGLYPWNKQNIDTTRLKSRKINEFFIYPSSSGENENSNGDLAALHVSSGYDGEQVPVEMANGISSNSLGQSSKFSYFASEVENEDRCAFEIDMNITENCSFESSYLSLHDSTRYDSDSFPVTTNENALDQSASDPEFQSNFEFDNSTEQRRSFENYTDLAETSYLESSELPDLAAQGSDSLKFQELGEYYWKDKALQAVKNVIGSQKLQLILNSEYTATNEADFCIMEICKNFKVNYLKIKKIFQINIF